MPKKEAAGKTEKMAVKTKKTAQPLELPPINLAAVYYALSRHPLYRGVEQGETIRAVFVMLSKDYSRTRNMLATVLWMGQMDSHALRIDIVTDDAGELLDQITKDMRFLSPYARLTSDGEVIAESKICYAQINLHSRKEEIAKAARMGRVSMANAQAAGSSLGKAFPSAWTAVLLGAGRSAAFAVNFCGGDPRCRALILEEESLAGLDKDFMRQCAPHALCAESPQRERFVSRLLEQAEMVNFFYSNASIGHAENNVSDRPKGWLEGNSSAASALHIPVKMRDAGLNPDARDKDKLAGKYGELIFDAQGEPTAVYRRLMLLEHRRWMMYQITEGWTLASIADCREYCFVRNGEENWNFKINMDQGRIKMHPGLLPAVKTEMLTGQDYRRFEREDQISQSGLDPLDKLSLKLHLLAKEKLELLRKSKHTEKQLARLKTIVHSDESARQDAAAFSAWIQRSGLRKHGKSVEYEAFYKVKKSVGRSSLDDMLKNQAQKAIEEIKKDVKLADEYFSNFDYKKADAVIMEHAGEIFCRPDSLTVIKLYSEGMLENVISALIMEPDQLILFGFEDMNRRDRIKKVLDQYTRRKAQVQSAPKGTPLLSRVKKALKSGGPVYIDTTGADERLVSEAWAACIRLSDESRLGIICGDARAQRVQNLRGAPLAAAFRRNISMRVEDLMELQGNARTKNQEYKTVYDKLLSLQSLLPTVFRYSANLPVYRTFIKCLYGGPGPVGAKISEEEYRSVSAGFWLYSLRELKAPTFSTVRIEGRIGELFKALKEDGQIKDYDINHINGPVELIDQLRWLLAGLPQKMDGALVYEVLSDGNSAIRFQPNRHVVAAWKKNPNDGGQLVRDISPRPEDVAQITDLCKKLGLKEVTLIPGKGLRLSGPQAWIRELEQLPKMLNLLRETMGSTASICLRKEEDETECRIVAFQGKAGNTAGDELLLQWKRYAPFAETAERVWNVSKERYDAAGMDGLLRKIKEHYSRQSNFEFSFEVDVTRDPDRGDLRVSGPARIVQAVEALAAELTRRQVGRLYFSPLFYTIEEEGAKTYHTYFPHEDKLNYAQRNALELAKNAGLIDAAAYFAAPSGKERLFARANIVLKDRDLLLLSEKSGNLLEFVVWNECFEHTDFSNVLNGYNFLWRADSTDASTENEVDVLAARGMELMLISVKDRPIALADTEVFADTKNFLYEIRVLANQFSRKTRAVLVQRSSNVPKGFDALCERAKNIGVDLIWLKPDPDHPEEPRLNDGAPLAEKLMEIMDRR